MKLIQTLSKRLKVSLIFISLAVVLISPGVVHCSGKVDPENNASTMDMI